MPTFQFKPRARRLALLLLTTGLAQLATPAAASISVEIHGVDETMEPNVRVYLSLERYKNSNDLSQEFVERLQERAEREVRAALRPFGFYEPDVKSKVSREPGSEPRYLVRIDVVPGKPVVVNEVNVTVTGPGSTDPKFTDITNHLAIRPGNRLNHAQYDELKGRLLRTAATHGYHDSRMQKSEMRVDPQSYSADIEISFETGPQYHFGATTITQDVIEDPLLRRFLRYQEGQPFDATELLRTQFALDDSQYFSTVEVLPGDRDREKLTVPISITAEPNRRNRYQYGVGYGTDTEIRGTASWENRRINERGHRFRTEIKAAALEQTLDARYIVPIGDPATEKFTLQLKGGHERLADIDDKSINFLPSLTHLTDSWFGDQQRWQRVTYLELLNTESEFVASGRRDKQTLLIPGISFALVPPAYLGEALFSRTLYAELRGSHNALGSDSDFLQVRVQAERVFDFASRWHVLLRGDLGATALSKTSDLAPSQRFFAGGDRSVRGFGINDLSPVEQVFEPDGVTPVLDDNGNITFEKVGGKHLFAGSAELIRDLPKNFAVAVFADAGNAFDLFGDPLMYSVGIGVRLRLPVVSVGIDVAQALTTPAGETDRPGPRLHLNFSPKL